MNATFKLQRALLARGPGFQRVKGSTFRHATQWRSYSTPLPDGTLPLQGIRVLDMTRVLAGVGLTSYRLLAVRGMTDITDMDAAILHADSWRLRVRSLPPILAIAITYPSS